MNIQSKLKKWGAGSLLVLVLLLLFGGTTFAETKTVTILHTNDIHGCIETISGSQIGYDTVAAAKKAEDALLLDAGDVIQGNAYAKSDYGLSMIALMNAAGYDAMALGNHDFDYGPDQLREAMQDAAFPVLCANAKRISTGQSILAGISKGEEDGSYVVIEKNGVKIGIFAIVTTTTKTEEHPAVVEDLDFTDTVQAAIAITSKLKNDCGCDLVICLCHTGKTAEDNNNSVTIAQAVRAQCGTGALDLILDGHTHQIYTDTSVEGTVIQQAGSYSGNLGKVVVSYDTETKAVTLTPKVLDAKTVTAQYTPDAEVTEKIQTIAGRLKEDVKLKTDLTLFGALSGVNISRMEETPMGNLAGEGFLIYGKKTAAEKELADLPVVAAINGGDVRNNILAGNITTYDYLNLNVFDNTMALIKITPKLLYEVMENSLSVISGQDPETGAISVSSSDGRFLQFAGYSCTWNPNAEKGSRVVSLVLDDGTVLDRNDNTTGLLLTTTRYISTGGNEYTMLSGCENLLEDEMVLTEQAIFTAYQALAEAQSVNGDTIHHLAVTHRLHSTVYDNSKTADFKITVGQNYAGKTVDYMVDGGDLQQGVIDDSGYLNLKLNAGGHCLKVGDADDVYISNFSGLDGSSEKTKVEVSIQNSLEMPETYLNAKGMSLQDAVDRVENGGEIRLNKNGCAAVISREISFVLNGTIGDVQANLKAGDGYALTQTVQEDGSILVLVKASAAVNPGTGTDVQTMLPAAVLLIVCACALAVIIKKGNA